MTAEFYLSTVSRIFKGREIADNKFSVGGKAIDLTKITNVCATYPLKTLNSAMLPLAS